MYTIANVSFCENSNPQVVRRSVTMAKRFKNVTTHGVPFLMRIMAGKQYITVMFRTEKHHTDEVMLLAAAEIVMTKSKYPPRIYVTQEQNFNVLPV
jgi:hypothetical protein